LLDFKEILDNDAMLISLGWENLYHSAIHLPQQLLAGRAADLPDSLPHVPFSEVLVWNQDDENSLLIQLLQYIYRDQIRVKPFVDLKELHSTDLVIIPDFHKNLQVNRLAVNTVYLSADGIAAVDCQKAVFKDIDSFDGLGIFLGWISRYLDAVAAGNSHKVFEKLAGFCAHKAGAIAWRQTLEHNLAKILAVKLHDLHNCRIVAGSLELEVIASLWKQKLQNWGNLPMDSGRIICLCSQLPVKKSCQEIILADGIDLLQRLISLYYLGNLSAIYLALINNIKYKKEL
jgi:hypothetical protein